MPQLKNIFSNNAFLFTLHPNHSLFRPPFPGLPLEVSPHIASSPSPQEKGAPLSTSPTLGYLIPPEPGPSTPTEVPAVQNRKGNPMARNIYQDSPCFTC